MSTDAPISPPASDTTTALVTEDFRFRVSGYRGFESDILRLRNANREASQSQVYLDWRYDTVERAQQPQVYWLDDPAGVPAGMAALIPRPYWFDGKAVSVGVLGDISIDASRRGKGLGRLLLASMTAHCGKEYPQRTQFVIPTEAAQRTLEGVGWRIGGKLIQHVMLLNPREKLDERFGNPGLSRAAGKIYRALLRTMLWLKTSRAFVLQLDTQLDESFERFWREFPKRGICLADRSVATLRWRYACHPHEQFKVASLVGRGGLAGYLVYERDGAEYTIYDVLAQSRQHLSRMLALFVRQALAEGLTSIRVTLNDRHPYRSVFRWMGFASRESALFLLHGAPKPQPNGPLTWILTQGDKDI